MEPRLELNHGPRFQTNCSFPLNLLPTHHLLTLFELQWHQSPSLMILQKWTPILLLLSLSCSLFFFFVKTYLLKHPPVYLVDFSCFKPPDFCKVPFSKFLGHASMIKSFNDDTVAFMAKILTSSGQSEQTYLPPALHHIPPRTDYQESIKEVEMVLFPVVEDLLSKTRVSPHNIDILIVNCSGFCPSPSLSSIIINKYSMRADIKSYSLSGMGCSAGAISIDLAHNLLKIHKNSYALVLSTEILSTGWYSGNEKSKLLLNCFFRMGSAAILLTNKKEAKESSKYKLFCRVRTQRAFEDKVYISAFREEDSDGKLGVTLKGDLLQVAGETLRSNIKILGSKILPPSEKLRYGISIIRKRFIDKSGEIYVPDFKTVIDHFCLPTTGRPVVKEIAKGLKLGEREVEAAFMTLHRFGNQSSSSLWYELAYVEAKDRVKKGDKVWQIGLGSGPKGNSVVWECLRPIVGESKKGPWADCVNQYPVAIA
ncbi:3-ketoacyl-CoA synthase 6 [Ricinus communis]|uniref:3-ketoacyl-CoA synthase n=1 Tax=Ricinus communis TaxID=3988 RepID=B9R9L1_RICCO|nr:3-ketoacyl-CoA synthase 6 [Ricinus communis]EEF51488.1 acyltransferase, putative [Ricinus communis]|eukprot:XP_002510886.3 3-ketoacyl-CoA synthase 6 [Ricinus communis]